MYKGSSCFLNEIILLLKFNGCPYVTISFLYSMPARFLFLCVRSTGVFFVSRMSRIDIDCSSLSLNTRYDTTSLIKFVDLRRITEMAFILWRGPSIHGTFLPHTLNIIKIQLLSL